MVVKTDSEYMAHELMNRVRHLHKALNQAEQIIQTLESENQRLKDVLISLTSENNESYVLCGEDTNEQTYLL